MEDRTRFEEVLMVNVAQVIEAASSVLEANIRRILDKPLKDQERHNNDVREACSRIIGELYDLRDRILGGVLPKTEEPEAA